MRAIIHAKFLTHSESPKSLAVTKTCLVSTIFIVITTAVLLLLWRILVDILYTVLNMQNFCVTGELCDQ